MNNQLAKVTHTLRELIKTLPAIRAQKNAEAIKKHLELIAYFQSRYDKLVSEQIAYQPA